MGQQPHCHLLKEELRLECLYYLFLYFFFIIRMAAVLNSMGQQPHCHLLKEGCVLVIRMDALPMACKSFHFYYFLGGGHFFDLDGAATTLSPVEGGIAALLFVLSSQLRNLNKATSMNSIEQLPCCHRLRNGCDLVIRFCY